MTETSDLGSLMDRVKGAQLKVAAQRDRAQKQQAQDRSRVVAQQAEERVAELVLQRTMRKLLEDEGVSVPALPGRLKEKARKEKANLRTAATRLRKADVEIASVADSSSVRGALETSKDVGRERERVFEDTYRLLRNKLCPEGLLETETDGLTNRTLAQKIRGWRELFRPERGVPSKATLQSELEQMKSVRAEWESAQDELKRQVQQLHEDLKRFLHAAAQGDAKWSMVTPIVREWLDKPENGTGYRVTKVFEA